MPVWKDEMSAMHRASTGTLISGLVIAGVGVVLLLDKLGVVEADVLWRLWPMIFAIAGVTRLVESRRTTDQMWGAFLISMGALLTLHEFGYIQLGIGQLWPLFLIAGGLLLAWHSNEIREGRKGFSIPAGLNTGGFNSGTSGSFQTLAFFGGIERKIEGKYFQGGSITAIFGGFKIDLTRAELDTDEAVIHVNAIFGGGEIIAPDSWRVMVEGAGIFGAFVDKTRYVPRTESPAKTLHVRGAAIFGGVEVKSW